MIKLIPFTLNPHAHYLRGWTTGEKDLVQFAGPLFQYPLTEDQIENWIADENRTVFAVLDDFFEGVIGFAELSDYDEKTAKIARVLIGASSERGKGYGTSLITKLVRIAFAEWNKKSVILNVYDWNKGAIRCYEKVGFSFTNRPPIIMEIGGETWNSLEMKIEKL
ncbi:MAG: GNAT family N-acetyltransferase [Saprospiraceae bacterium]